MAIFNLYSKRQKALRGEVPDVYLYDQIPNPLRVQVVYILRRGLDLEGDKTRNGQKAAERIVKTLCEEYGLFVLPPTKSRYGIDWSEELFAFMTTVPEAEKFIDAVELAFRYVHIFTRSYDWNYHENASERADNAINDLNTRFKEHGIGYSFIEGEIVRIDSELLHAEAVKPALRLLSGSIYRGPHDEFLAAYEHYRHARNKEALVDCLKAFESTMKAICDKRGWDYPAGASASRLIEVCLSKGLIPSFWQTQMSALKTLLESSVPTGRNKLGGHGQGSTPTEVPNYIVAYMLHMTASTLVFLVSAEEQLPSASA